MDSASSANMAGIADLVAKAFLDLKQDMDKIIVQTTAGSSASPTKALESSAGQLSALPALQLHGRTVSEAPGYDDCLLPNPICKLPEAVPDIIDITATDFHLALQADAEVASDTGPVTIVRRTAVGTAESQDTVAPPTAAGAPVSPAGGNIPKAEGPCRILSQTSISEPASPPQIIGDAISPTAASRAAHPGQQSAEKPFATSQLSYKDLLEKAMGGFDARLAQQMQASLRKPSPDHNTGSPQRQPVVGSTAGSHSQSKFPASVQKQSAGAKPESPASPGSLRIFKQDSRSARRVLQKLEADQRTSADDAGAEASRRRSSDDKSAEVSRRSRSASREKDAMAAHVKRFSPGTTAGGAEQNLTEAKSNSRGANVSAGVASPGYIENLYERGKQKQQKRAQVSEKRSLSPVRLSEEAWNKVSNRLYTDAQKKDKKLSEMREKEDHARQEAMHPTAVASLWDRKHGVKRSSGNSGPVGSRAPDLAFYGRQQALLDRRAERARQRRPSDYLTPEEAKECTFHPEISRASRELHRSVTDMHKWDLHRKLHVMELEDEKSSHEFDGHTFMPEINDLSRKIALQHYAASPDPNRPWTTSPRHTSAPVIRPYSPARSERSRSVSPHSQHSDVVVASAPANILRHSIAGPHMQYVQAVQHISPIRNSALLTAPTVHTSPPAAQLNPRLWSAPAAAAAAAAAGLSKSVDLAHVRQQQQQQAATLPPGVVMGVPVAAAGTALPEDAVVIQVPVSSISRGSGSSQGPLFGPVAPGDGVAFISLGPIRTAAPAAAAAGSNRDRQVLSPVQAQMGLEQGLGSGDWARATAAAVRGDDSAANTPIIRSMSGAVPARMLRTFRDDSAGGVHGPARTTSAGGAWFSPVLSAHKADPLVKQKQQHGADSQRPGLQPTLSDATRAALELSQQFGVREAGSQAGGYAAAARQQAVPAYYMAVDSRENPLKGSNSYSQRYKYTKGAKSTEGAEHVYSGGAIDAVTAAKAAAMHDWQQQQTQQQHPFEPAVAGAIQRTPSLQKYSTAQLLNAKNRSSMGGGVALVPGAMPLSPTAAAAAAGAALNAQGQVLTQMASTQLLPGSDSALDAALQGAHMSQLEQLAAQVQAEGLLSQTQSVPYELMVEPRSRLVLSSSKDGSGSSAQQTLTLLGRTEDGGADLGQATAEQGSPAQQRQRSSGGNAKAAAAQILSGSYTVNYSSTTTTVTGPSSQSLVQSLLRPVAGSPFLPNSRDGSRVGTPAASSNNLLQMGQRAAPVGSSKLSTVSKARLNVESPDGGSSGSSPDRQQQQSPWPVEPADSATPTAPPAAAASSPAPGEDMSAADVLGLLFSAELSPEVKARRMAELFGKTMSKHNIQVDNLQETLEAVSKAASATPSASGAATTTRVHAPTEDSPSFGPRGTEPASSAGQREALDTSENMQELLMRVSADIKTPNGGGRGRTPGDMQSNEQAAQYKHDNDDVFLDTEEAQVDDSGLNFVITSSAGGGGSTHSSSGSSSSSPSKGGCRITQFAAVARRPDQ